MITLVRLSFWSFVGWIIGTLLCPASVAAAKDLDRSTETSALSDHRPSRIELRIIDPAHPRGVERADKSQARLIVEIPQASFYRMILLTILLAIIVAMLAFHCLQSLREPQAMAIVRGPMQMTSEEPPSEVLSIVRSLLLPRFTEWLNSDAVQQILAQRDGLSAAHALAEAELAKLEDALIALHAPLQYRLEVYEQRIRELEEALRARDDESRGVIETMIRLTRQKLEGESRITSSPEPGTVAMSTPSVGTPV